MCVCVCVCVSARALACALSDTVIYTTHSHVADDFIVYVLELGINPYLFQEINIYESLTNLNTFNAH